MKNKIQNKKALSIDSSITIDTSPTNDTVLTSSDIETLLFMQQEEQLARDVYDELYETFGLKVFDNISDSEQKHVDSVTSIIEQYDIESIASGEAGDFTIEELSGLYEQLLSQGSASLEDALMVGALIEEVDIQDLQIAISETDNPQVVSLYTNLLNASNNHLNAFVDQLENIGMAYEAQVISEDVLAQILESDNAMAQQQQGHGNQGNNAHNSGTNGQGTNGHQAQEKGFVSYQGGHNDAPHYIEQISMVGVDAQSDCPWA
ncbi:MAG: DUF2202 domain-containing protein [Gammaproteobacteria bacterium]|nr:DUF2202 domain-containing protein [Gammaproteobacteria bacterium]